MASLLHDALLLGRNKEVAREELLVAEGKKEPASFTAELETIDIVDIFGDARMTIPLRQTEEGYLEIEVLSNDEFIGIERRVISSSDFRDNRFELPYKIIESKLHRGKNFGSITLQTSLQKITIPVTVNIRVRIKIGDSAFYHILPRLTKEYIKFRMGRIDADEWVAVSEEIIGSVDGNDEKSMFLMLYKAQLFITVKRYEDAKNIIEFMAEQIPKLKKVNYELGCYFYYIKSLYELDDVKTEEAAVRVRQVYERYPSWRVLWTLMYLDYVYLDDLEQKLIDIETEFVNGCNSPIMNFEALTTFRSKPELLCHASNFEMQVLFYGAKQDFLNASLVQRFAELLLHLKNEYLAQCNLTLAKKILKAAYVRFPIGDVLRALCRIIIFTDDRSSENHVYFADLFKRFIDSIPGCYEYFIYTMDTTVMDPLPENIIDYFMAHSASMPEYCPYIFANIIYNRESKPEMYERNIDRIIDYADKQVSYSISDEYMPVIYKEMLEHDMLTKHIQIRLFEILSTKEILCPNDRMEAVMVFHKELNTFQEVSIKKMKAFVKLYSADALILFKDPTGNIYHNVDHTVIDLMSSNEYLDLCIQGVPVNDYMFLSDTLPLLRAYKDPIEVLHYLTTKMDTDRFRKSYIQKVIRDTVVYFSRGNKDEEVHEELLSFLNFDLDAETRGKIIEILIEKTLYRDAYEEIKKNGFAGVSDENIAHLAHVLAELSHYERDELLLEMCEIAFTKTNFDPEVFEYLSLYYDKDMEIMMDLVRAGHAYNQDCVAVEERIIRKYIKTGEHPEYASNLFEKYYREGQDEGLKHDYLVLKAGNYFYKDEFTDVSYFKFLEEQLLKNVFYPDVAVIAYLQYMGYKNIQDENILKMIERRIKDLTRRSIMLEQFKNYEQYCGLPAALSNAIIVSKLQEGGIISFDITGESGTVHREEQLTEIFEGYFAKYINLFYGESVTYSLDRSEPVTVSYFDMKIIYDESRYSDLDRLMVLKASGDMNELDTQAKEYFIKNELINRLF